MSVYKPKNSPFYHFDFQLGGRRFHGSTAATSRRDAEAIERDRKDEAKKEIAATAGTRGEPMTIAEAVTRYWAEVGMHHKRPDQTEWSLAWVLNALGERKLVRDISDDDVARMVAKRRGEPVVNRAAQKSKRRGKTAPKLVSNSTVNRSMTEPLRKVLLRARTIWKQDVQTIAWRTHMLREPQERVRAATVDEEAALFATLPEQYRPIVRFALRTGFRLAECVGVTVGDVDWAERIVTVRGKGGRVDTVPLPNDVRDMLWSLGRQGLPARAPMFVRENGAPITVSGLDTAYGRAVKRAGIENLRFHDLRHTAATRLLRKGGNLVMAQHLLRHTEIGTTARYAHSFQEDLRRVMDDVAQDAAQEIPEKSRSAEGENPKVVAVQRGAGK